MSTHRIAPIPAGFDSPFAYSSLSHVLTLWQCDRSEVEKSHRTLIGDYQFVGDDDSVLVAVSYQSYLADYGRAALISHELELGAVVLPPGVEPPTLEDFLSGADQRGIAGIWPSAVYCDCDPAIAAGRAIYGEPKFAADFEIDVPAPNAPGDAWHVSAAAEDRTCELELELEGKPVERPGQPIVNYGKRDSGEVVSSRWDIFLGGRWWGEQASASARFSEAVARSASQRHAELMSARCVQVREHRSPVVAQRSRPFYPQTAL